MRIIKYIAILLFAVFSFVACSQIFPDATHLTIRECSQHPAVEIQLFRSATLKINYAGKIILIDPMLSPKGCFESFAGKEKNPIVELPLSISEILDGVDIVLLTHNHPDHWDKVAGESIPKQIPVITQKVDREAIQEYGFLNVIDVDVSTTWDGIEIQRTNGKHGTDDILEAEPLLGTVSGYILKADGYPTVYILGDTILNDEVRNKVKSSGADIFVLNSGGAKLPVPGFENHLILMDTKQAIEVVNMVPKAKFVAVHMEALDHCTVSRAELRKVAVENGIDRDRLIIPNDGEVIRF
jgi:L-ascorbate metabolism protein UlaG (beta-lactamase superfamily)